MKTASSELIDHLNNAQEFILVDLYTIILIGYEESNLEGVYRYSSYDQSITINNITWSATNALIQRERVRLVVGVEVDSLSVKIFASDIMQIKNYPFMQACAKGILDGATIKLERAFIDITGEVIGVINMFQGRVSDVQVTRSEAEITVNSDLELLNVQMPRHIYQPGCQHSLYDSGCKISRQTKEVITNISNATATMLTLPYISYPAGYFDLGYMSLVPAGEIGEKRTIRSWDGLNLNLLNPLTQIPAIGTQIYLYPGCDKSKTTCEAKFNNKINFRGFPYIPAPETVR
jgi:uncharacterized phage protein (TIGR02218 family)